MAEPIIKELTDLYDNWRWRNSLALSWKRDADKYAESPAWHWLSKAAETAEKWSQDAEKHMYIFASAVADWPTSVEIVDHKVIEVSNE